MATNYISGGVKIPGLGNGTNWQEMIDKLEQIEMQHMLQLGRWKSDWTTRLDAFNQLSMSLAEYSSALKSMNSEETFMAKVISSSNSGIASIRASGTADDTSHNLEVNQLAGNSYANLVFNVSSKTDAIYSGSGMAQLQFTLGGTAQTMDVPPSTTLEGLKNLINQRFGSPTGGNLGMKATIIDQGGKQTLQLYSTRTGAGTDIAITGDTFLNPVKDDPIIGWTYQAGQNAQVRINGYPAAGWTELATNTITSIPGLTINLQAVGNTTISVSLDMEHIKTNIYRFVEATNAVRALIHNLSSVNSQKMTVSAEYAESQFETQKGGVLTGNYGIQLIASKLKTAVMSKPVGFAYMEKDPYGVPIGGDIFASLSHLGIKTDDVQGSPTYGQLIFEDNIKYILNGQVELITLDDAIAMDPQGIAELFAAKNKPVVDSNNFGFASMVDGISKAGEYEVSYEVAADGKLIPGTIFINGKAATYYAATNQIMLVRGSGANNDADGILLDIYNNTPTNPGNPHTGKLRLKQGMLNNMIQMVDVDFLDPDDGDADNIKGTIPILQKQYKTVIDNINNKITKEDERITLWRRRMDLRFARLDATLKYYSEMEKAIQSQISQLGGGSSS